MASRPGPSPQGSSPEQRARAALEAGRPDEAVALARRLCQKDPKNAAASAILAEALLRLGEPEQALFAADRAASVETGLLTIRALRALKRSDDALDRAQRLTSSHPQNPDVLAAYASCLGALGRPEDALEHLRAASALAPEDANRTLALAASLLETGRTREGVATIGAVAMRHPTAPALLSAFASALNFSDQASPAYVAEAHRAFGRALERTTPPPPAPPINTDPDRPLRVGFVSRDLHRHSCAYFLEPLLASLDPGRIETTCYSLGSITDDFSRRLQESSGRWRDMPSAPPTDAVQQIRRDEIDVLVDLMGLSGGVRLAIFAARPAPLQLTYLAYPNTTGMSRIDARVVDEITDPPTPDCDALASERLVRLDRCFLCYQPDARAPDVQPRAANDPFTFVSFNTIQKVNPTTLDLWADVLRACPGSRMLIKHRGAGEEASAARVSAWFESRAVDPDRIELVGHIKPIDEHLGQYHRADLALDTFPYCGTTTTCEAAWMGVPTLTLVGDRHSARVGASLNTALGLEHLTASTPEAFVRIASDHAQDPANIRAARLTLRERMRASPLCDAPAHARAFTQAIRSLWDERAQRRRP